MYSSHSHSHLVSCCHNENVNQALEVYAFKVELLKNKVLRKMALKFCQLSASNMNKVVIVMRWVHMFLHKTEMECRIELQVASFERGEFPLSETLKIAKTMFST